MEERVKKAYKEIYAVMFKHPLTVNEVLSIAYTIISNIVKNQNFTNEQIKILFEELYITTCRFKIDPEDVPNTEIFNIRDL